MYGFVNSALEKLIKRRFGIEKWNEVVKHANVMLGDTDSFQVNHVYKDDDTYVLVGAAAEVLGLDAATILEMFGEQFLMYCQESGYDKTLQLLGRSLQDFLTNLDALHDHLSIIYPQMDAPSFRCTEGIRKSEFLLHYYSDRVGLENIVMGIVKSVAREFYDVEVEMRLLVKKGQEGSDHSIFSIREMANLKEDKEVGEEVLHSVDSFYERQLISSQTFCKAFPFHIIFDTELNILQVGSSLACVLPNFQVGEHKLPYFFALERPRMKFTFEHILSHINTIFILRMIPVLGGPASTVQGERMSFSFAGNDPMRLRGQMVYLPESDAMLFLCSPRVKRLHDLEQRGLYLSDIPIHDATRGLLMMSQAAESEFSNSVRLEELIIELRVVQKSLEEEKQRISDLLREMLPMSVADSLMAGQMVEAERFESVTVLFSDIVGFTSICSKSEPMQIVNMLNKLYSMFDQVVGQNHVYKVETIGDAYMVVGGLPESNPTHAEDVANQALDMMHYCKQVTRPDNKEPIMMRIGIHSGEVVAGIVGRRMPRYCLFGNTVNVASRTESNGMPGRIQVTEYTHKLLLENPHFVFEYRGPMEFKNVPKPVLCYFLVENKAKDDWTPIAVPDEPLQAYEFIVSRGPSPPSTPFAFASTPASLTPAELSKRMKFPFDFNYCPLPDIMVVKPSPTATPKTSVTDLDYNPGMCPGILRTSPTPPLLGSEPGSTAGVSVLEDDTPMSPLSRHVHQRLEFMKNRPSDLEITNKTRFTTSMSPLQEDSHEDIAFQIGASPENENGDLETPKNENGGLETPKIENGDLETQKIENGDLETQKIENGDLETPKIKNEDLETPKIENQPGKPDEVKGSENTDEQIPDMDGLVSERKISDTSNQSAKSAGKASEVSKEEESEQRKHSVASTDSEALRKYSNSTQESVEEDLQFIKRQRAGSVGKAVEYFDTLARTRRTGLSTTAFAKKPPRIEIASDQDVVKPPVQSPLQSAGGITVNGNVHRKSLDSIGSSGSND